ncbi:hypothetical protein [Pseudoalteromonas sp. NBT06-2]|uniref:hypothetical protein n=1 Tax=Pseudoalteromonas sp. NBT06-2 TaxID=2025950 RepID=UPI001140E4C3|nr:hypothetical protein [Pseudoalteromonas sp. NBT06-2]
MAAKLAKQKATIYASEENYLLASRLAVQSGDIASAAKLMEQVIKFKENKENLLKLHEYSRWQGNLVSALQVSLKLLKYQPNEKQLRAGLEEASSIADLAAMSDFYFVLVQKQWLKNDEYESWLTITDKAYGAEYVVTQLEKILKDLILIAF